MACSASGSETPHGELALLVFEFDLEQDMQNAGQKAWREAMEEVDRKTDGMGHAKRAHLVLRALPLLMAGIKRELQARKGRPSDLRQWLGNLPVEEIAYTALRLLVNDALHQQTQQTTAIRIGEALDRAVTLQKARQANSHLWLAVKDVDSLAELQSRLGEIKTVISDHQRADDLTTQYFRIGNKLLQLALEYTGLFQIKYPDSKRERSNRIIFTVKAEIELKQLQSRLAKAAPPQYQPLVAPPKAWKSIDDGGYYSLPLPLIKSRGCNRYDLEHRKTVSERSVPSLFGAANILQAVPWSLNTDVLAVMKPLLENHGSDALKNALEAEKEPAPEPVPEEADVASDPATAWIDRKIIQEVLVEPDFKEPFQHFAKVVSLATLYSSRPMPFYFTWRADFRGRVYPVVTHLQPQGHGSARALLQFAQGRPLGKTGEYWLALHGANMLKTSGSTAESKVAWIYDQTKAILAVAKDPRGTVDFWALGATGQLKKTAWEALAFCFEWAHLQRDGAKFVSHLPVAMDGTCNAIQHLAVIVGDAELARLSNVTPSPDRVDLYQEVAQEVLARIERAPAGDSNKKFLCELGVPLATLITRDLCKAPVMTTPYGVTPYGRRDQVRAGLSKIAAFEAKIKSLPKAKRWDARWAATCYIADHITDVLTGKLGAASELMAWLQDTADIMVRHKKPVRWVTPAEFPVVQAYLRNKSKIVRTQMSRLERFRSSALTIKQPTSQLARKKARNGIVANFVHSHDAAHMMLTTIAAHRQGISDVRMIHDSFATHACNAEALGRILREEFATMYAGKDPLRHFYDICASELGPAASVLKPPPRMGCLDVNCVRDAAYFFS